MRSDFKPTTTPAGHAGNTIIRLYSRRNSIDYPRKTPHVGAALFAILARNSNAICSTMALELQTRSPVVQRIPTLRAKPGNNFPTTRNFV